ncbi:MAG: hypothetical protein AAGG69_00525 [Pseudomonadota bacterium]
MDGEIIRVGYGFNRPPKDFANLNCDKVFIDMRGTERYHFRELCKFVRDFDDVAVVMVANGDFGPPKMTGPRVQEIESLGGSVEWPADRGEARKKRKPGRPQRHHWTDEEKKAICPLWHSAQFDAKYVEQRATDMIGKPIRRDALNKACGPRFKRK